MTKEIHTLIARLQHLPPDIQAELGPKLNDYLNKFEDLRQAIQDGLNSGPAIPGDEVFDRLEKKYRDMAQGRIE